MTMKEKNKDKEGLWILKDVQPILVFVIGYISMTDKNSWVRSTLVHMTLPQLTFNLMHSMQFL